SPKPVPHGGNCASQVAGRDGARVDDARFVFARQRRNEIELRDRLRPRETGRAVGVGDAHASRDVDEDRHDGPVRRRRRQQHLRPDKDDEQRQNGGGTERDEHGTLRPREAGHRVLPAMALKYASTWLRYAAGALSSTPAAGRSRPLSSRRFATAEATLSSARVA